MGLSQTQRVPCNAKLATNKQAKCEYEYVITYKHRGRSLQKKNARMKNGLNRYKKVRIDLGLRPKECLQS